MTETEQHNRHIILGFLRWKESLPGIFKGRPIDLVDMYFKNIHSEASIVVAINKSGYAGISSSGQIVDRREYPSAVPIEENSLLGIAKVLEL